MLHVFNNYLQAGTCTRCPTELRLIQRDGPFECHVGVRYEYNDYTQKPLTNISEKQIGSTNDRLKVASIVTAAQSYVICYIFNILLFIYNIK